jgi:hypothetical protein
MSLVCHCAFYHSSSFYFLRGVMEKTRKNGIGNTYMRGDFKMKEI